MSLGAVSSSTVREVSCRALDPFFQAVDRARIPRAELAAGLTYDLAHLTNKHERIDWDAFRQFMSNVRRFFDRPAITEIGAVGVKSPGFRSFALIGRTLFSADGFYRWALTSGGMGNQLFSNMTPSFRELRLGRLDLDLQIAPGYAPCDEFFYFAIGGFQALPELVGVKRASVRMLPIERGARFEIEYEARDTRRARLLRRLTRGSDARATAKELNDAIHVLERRNVELERVQGQLDVAYQVGQEIWGHRDLEAVGTALMQSLIGRYGISGARITIARAPGFVGFQGDVAGAPSASVALPGDPSAGQLELWTVAAGDDAQRLAELVAPTIALAIENAHAYRELAEYQAGLERLVEQRTAELREAQASREKFFGNISHEIRTPLSLIMLAARDIQTRAGDQLDQRSSTGLLSITEGARKLLRLVDELLLLAAGQAEKLVLAPEPMDLASLASQIAAAWTPAAEAAGLLLSTRLPSSLTINADPVALERVVSNLVSNAIKYTPPGGSVEVVVEPDAAGPIIRVIDTGRGIDPELASRLFGRFERAAGDDRRKAGTGIGLALVKQLVDGHGGTVAAIPRDLGTEFRVQLPASIVIDNMRVTETKLRTTHAPASAPVLVSGQMFSPPGVSKGSILVAEDDSRLADSIARLLADHYTVVVALNGLDALEQVRRVQPQLLITDVDMPGMTGIELAARFREVTGDKLSPIIILSAVVDLNTRVAGLEAGAIDYVGKPFEPKELLARVEAQFRMRDMAVRLHRAEQLSTLGILTSGLAHELRNPANGIVNAIEPLRESLPPELVQPETAVAELLDAMKSSADQMWFLVNQLLGFRSNSELALRSVVLADLVSRAVRLANGALTGIDVRVRLDQPGSIMCAPPLMVQVLTNLIENAGHAAGKGGWIEVRSAERDGRAAIEVTDSGPGVPSALRERIFEPFFTTKDPKPGAGGTGLGLSVARTIIHRHRGTLELRERAGKTAFVIEVPHKSNLASPKGGI